MKQNFDIQGMSCAACAVNIEKSVNKLKGVQKAEVNLLANRMTAEFDEQLITEKDIIKAVNALGYKAASENNIKDTESGKKDSSNNDEAKILLIRFFVSLIFMLPLMYFSMGHMIGLPAGALDPMKNPMNFTLLQLLLATPVLVVNGRFFINGIKGIIKRAPNMDTLIFLGASAAYIYSIIQMFEINSLVMQGHIHHAGELAMNIFFESAVMILTLVTLGKYFEAKSKGRTKRAVEKLLRLRPETALVLRDGMEVTIPSSEIMAGDIVILKPGDYIPVDGVVIEGNSTVDNSAITGEYIPVEVSVGKSINSAAINIGGTIKMRAEKVGNDTTLSKIIELVENAGGSKAPIAKLADKVSGIFVPIVTLIAVVTFIVWAIIDTPAFALNLAISVVVISCPCALGLATPVAIMVATGRGAQMGILFKNAEVLEKLHLADAVLLDKTATITEGKPKVVKVNAFSRAEKEIMTLAYALEKGSSHPLANSIIEYAEAIPVEKLSTDSFEYISGKGIKGSINGKNYLAGSDKLLIEAGIILPEVKEDTTKVYIAEENELIGIIHITDKVKEGSKKAISRMKERGLKVAMLTGDNKRNAEAVARSVGLEDFFAEVLPADKLNAVDELQKSGVTVMVGDGINDAPALKHADIGIAIGSGTDIAIEAADVILVKDDLNDAVNAMELSGSTVKNIKENLFWAFFYNCVGIPVAAGALVPLGIMLNPMFAAAAMSLSSIFVVSNALRLTRFKPGKKGRSKHKKENTIMKIMKIEGMSCGHCSKRVEDALNAISGVNAKVNLELKQAEIILTKDIKDKVLKTAVEKAGYEVISIE